jgi:hypothetical protein
VLEPQRSQYLRALGIEVYVPRWILPGAKQSPVCEWDFLPSADAGQPQSLTANPTDAIIATPITSATAATIATTATTATTATIAAKAEGLQRVLPDELRVDLSTPPAAAKTVVDIGNEIRNATAVIAPPKIALSVIVSEGGILIVDDAPSNTALRADYLRLLSNLLFALSGRAMQPSLDVFLWPLAKRPQLDQGPVAARETLAAHLQKQIQQHAVHTVLLLGETAQQWCEFDNEKLQCIKSLSALACLRAPTTKRTLWNDIRRLAVAR